MSGLAAALPTSKSSTCSNSKVSNDSVTFRSFIEGTDLASVNAKNELAIQMIKMKLHTNENMAPTVNPKFSGYSVNYFMAFMQGSF